MSRWQELVDNLLTDLETETPGADHFRMNIDHKIWKVEQKVSKTAPITLYETTVRRLQQLKNDPANQIWREARSLLENPWLRVKRTRSPLGSKVAQQG